MSSSSESAAPRTFEPSSDDYIRRYLSEDQKPEAQNESGATDSVPDSASQVPTKKTQYWIGNFTPVRPEDEALSHRNLTFTSDGSALETEILTKIHDSPSSTSSAESSQPSSTTTTKQHPLPSPSPSSLTQKPTADSMIAASASSSSAPFPFFPPVFFGKMTGWELWKKMGAPKFVLAPMVDMSELSYRMLTRRYGAQLCYTPMLHSAVFLNEPHYRKEVFTTNAADRPLMVQFCGNRPSTLLQAAKYVEPYCDTVDINFGCPQGIARKGHYGAYLMEDMELVFNLVRTLHLHLSVPVSCKIRLFPKLEDSIKYAKMIEAAGCQILGVHGRTRDQKRPSEMADWDAIKAIKESVSIPVIANGNIRHLDDVHECLRYTGCEAVMSAVSILENPSLFTPVDQQPSVVQLAREYLDLARDCKTPSRMIRAHMFKMLGRIDMHTNCDLRDRLNELSFTKPDWWTSAMQLLDEVDRRVRGETTIDEGYSERKQKSRRQLIKEGRRIDRDGNENGNRNGNGNESGGTNNSETREDGKNGVVDDADHDEDVKKRARVEDSSHVAPAPSCPSSNESLSDDAPGAPGFDETVAHVIAMAASDGVTAAQCGTALGSSCSERSE